MASEDGSSPLIELAFWLASLLIGVIAFLLGIGMLREAQRGRRNARESSAWPTVLGRVTLAAVDEMPTNDGYSNFWIRFAYEYEVDGRRHESSAITGATVYQLASQDKAEEILAPYPVGAQVYVFYNPRRPQDAVLQPGAAIAAEGLKENAGCGTTMGIFGIVTIVGVMIALAKDKGWF
ncbi:MAG TPA: DUF3592 domain-containing protein [bacterium]|nr:DUF3592 domain-containing protein [bacterium]